MIKMRKSSMTLALLLGTALLPAGPAQATIFFIGVDDDGSPNIAVLSGVPGHNPGSPQTTATIVYPSQMITYYNVDDPNDLNSSQFREWQQIEAVARGGTTGNQLFDQLLKSKWDAAQQRLDASLLAEAGPGAGPEELARLQKKKLQDMAAQMQRQAQSDAAKALKEELLRQFAEKLAQEEPGASEGDVADPALPSELPPISNNPQDTADLAALSFGTSGAPPDQAGPIFNIDAARPSSPTFHETGGPQNPATAAAARQRLEEQMRRMRELSAEAAARNAGVVFIDPAEGDNPLDQTGPAADRLRELAQQLTDKKRDAAPDTDAQDPPVGPVDPVDPPVDPVDPEPLSEVLRFGAMASVSQLDRLGLSLDGANMAFSLGTAAPVAAERSVAQDNGAVSYHVPDFGYELNLSQTSLCDGCGDMAWGSWIGPEGQNGHWIAATTATADEIERMTGQAYYNGSTFGQHEGAPAQGSIVMSVDFGNRDGSYEVNGTGFGFGGQIALDGATFSNQSDDRNHDLQGFFGPNADSAFGGFQAHDNSFSGVFGAGRVD